MTPAVAPPLTAPLGSGVPALPPSVGVAVLAVLLVVLTVKVMLQAAARFPRRGALRLLDFAIAPLLIAFVIVVLERFRDLA